MYEGLYLERMREIADLRGKIYDIEKDCLRLMAENKRLRETLTLIADDDCPKSCKTLDKQCDPCIARAALEEK